MATNRIAQEEDHIEDPCVICLGDVEDESRTDVCSHHFCFSCITEWSKVRNLCPLCKREFSSISHDFQSDGRAASVVDVQKPEVVDDFYDDDDALFEGLEERISDIISEILHSRQQPLDEISTDGECFHDDYHSMDEADDDVYDDDDDDDDDGDDDDDYVDDDDDLYEEDEEEVEEHVEDDNEDEDDGKKYLDLIYNIINAEFKIYSSAIPVGDSATDCETSVDKGGAHDFCSDVTGSNEYTKVTASRDCDGQIFQEGVECENPFSRKRRRSEEVVHEVPVKKMRRA